MPTGGWNDSKMANASAGTFVVEMGIADDTYITGDTGSTASNSVPTRLKDIIGGWKFSHDAAGVTVLAQGCVTSQVLADGTDYIDFTMEATVGGYGTWLLFGDYNVKDVSEQYWVTGKAGQLKIEVGCWSGLAADTQTVATKLTHVVGGMLLSKENNAGVPIPGSTNANGTVDFTCCDASGGPFVYFIAGW